MAVERITPGSNSWTESYAIHAERYRGFLTELEGKTVLDAACGVGYGTHLIATHGAKHVTGIDLSTDALEVAKSDFQHPNISYRKANCLNLPFDSESFDAVTSFETIEHLESPAKFLEELHRIIKPGGRLFLSCPNSLTHSLSPIRQVDNPWHLSEMTYTELVEVVSERFRIDSAYHQTPSLAHVCAEQIEHLNVCIGRSIALKMENVFRKLLGKERIMPLRSQPSLATNSFLTPYPVLPIAQDQDSWSENAHVFLVAATRK